MLIKSKNNHLGIALSSIFQIDQDHHEGYICSSKHLWNRDGMKPSAKYGFPINFRFIDNKQYATNVVLPFSSSGIFTKEQLENSIQQIQDDNPNIKRIVVIDLLKEYHGFFNGIPASFRAEHNAVNHGVKYDQICNNEQKIFNLLANKYIGHNIDIISGFQAEHGGIELITQIATLASKSILTEKGLIEEISRNTKSDVEIIAKRFPVADHNSPSNEAVISFINFIQEDFNPESDWLHIHCHGGKGRSTTFSIFFDIMMRMKYGTLQQTPLDEIIKEHHAIGGIDIEKAMSKQNWKQELSKQRYEVVQKFYKVALESQFGSMEWPYEEIDGDFEDYIYEPEVDSTASEMTSEFRDDLSIHNYE